MERNGTTEQVIRRHERERHKLLIKHERGSSQSTGRNILLFSCTAFWGVWKEEFMPGELTGLAVLLPASSSVSASASSSGISSKISDVALLRGISASSPSSASTT